MSDRPVQRIDRVLRQIVEEFDLDLNGLGIYTEAATGAYLHTPILAAMGGARKVHALAADSSFGPKEAVREQTLAEADRLGVADRLEVALEKTPEDVADCDVFTNSGSVRPIDREMISWMKPTAVVPLMWETWEFREADLDLGECRRRGILVLGTHESTPPLSMYSYPGHMAMKLVYELGLEGHRTRVLLLGGGNLGQSIHDHFRRVDVEVGWFSDTHERSGPYDSLHDHFLAEGGAYDVAIVAEHERDVLLMGDGGLVTFDEIRQVCPLLRIGVISGNLDVAGLKASSLAYCPDDVRPFGYMSYQPYHLGPRPVLELYAGGLKVGESMARARLRGLSVDEAAAWALAHSPAMDFPDSGRQA